MTTIIEFPIDQAEQAAQLDPKRLLPVDVFRLIAEFVNRAREARLEAKGEDYNSVRRHDAIMINGARGTGKSSVLVNLKGYLANRKGEFERVHVLSPVDPTLLETDDDMFLNVIVAAIVSDPAVQEAQRRYPEKRKAFYDQLQRLGSALESLQVKDREVGIEKLRSFMGTARLALEAHDFFAAVLTLLDKDLLVFTIDDVDTSLEHAFANLEVIRRYLTSPCVLPIVSGDLGLYREVTWRNFHGRLTEHSRIDNRAAYQRAVELAGDYHRKVLPLQYRLEMPDVGTYLANANIRLTWERGGSLSLPFFHQWLQATLQGPVNGLEDSELTPPIPTVRALAQLANRLQLRIQALAGICSQHGDSETRVTRLLWNSDARKDFQAEAINWALPLRHHFIHEPKGARAFLVLHAITDWAVARGPLPDATVLPGIFDTPLFQPLAMPTNHAFAEPSADMTEWKLALSGRVPQSWLDRLPTRSHLPYPIPEIGWALANSYKPHDRQSTPRQILIEDLSVDTIYYASSHRAPLVRIGRIFEIVILGLARDVTSGDLERIRSRPPFYSISAVAPTKTLMVSDEAGDEVDRRNAAMSPDAYERELAKLAEDINAWRHKHELSGFNLSPWLVYKVFNKVMNQAHLFNRPVPVGASASQPQRKEVLSRAKLVFLNLWSAFGSFEKGPVFKLKVEVADVNIKTDRGFVGSPAYNRNILPFLQEKSTCAVTAWLADHPIYLAFGDEALSPEAKPTAKAPDSPRRWLRRRLGLSTTTDKTVSERIILNRLKGANLSLDALDKLRDEFHTVCDPAQPQRRIFDEAYLKYRNSPGSEPA